MAKNKQRYKVKHSSGRILGPLDLDRIRAFIAKNQFTGSEIARLHPDGEWQDILSFAEISELFLERLSEIKTGQANSESSNKESDEQVENPTIPLGPTQLLPGATIMLPATTVQHESTLGNFDPALPKSEGGQGTKSDISNDSTMLLGENANENHPDLSDEDEKTILDRLEMADPDNEKTVFASFTKKIKADQSQVELESDNQEGSGILAVPSLEKLLPNRVLNLAQKVGLRRTSQPERAVKISEEKTILLKQNQTISRRLDFSRLGTKELIKGTIIAVLLGTLGYDFIFDEPKKVPSITQVENVRARMPVAINEEKPDPQQSQKFYQQGIKYYILDNVVGYKNASEMFLKAAGYDMSNVKALAMLASSYINLIDSSNKDEKYFSVISRLIDLSGNGGTTLPETIIANVEFLITVNRADAAVDKIVEYTQKYAKSIGMEMFLYISYALYHQGKPAEALNYISRIQENKVFTPRIFYLRGQIAEQLGNYEEARSEFSKALKLSSAHAKSRLKLVELMSKTGRLKEAGPLLEDLVGNPKYLSPKDLAQSYFYYGNYYQLIKNPDVALGAYERAVRLDKSKHEYMLELYTLKSKSGDSVLGAKKQAKMYILLGEGEKLLKEGKYQSALSKFVQAREANLDSTVPLVRIGDMFVYLNDMPKARMNYQKAAEKAPKNIEIWSKYINSLIQTYEWSEAQAAMEKFRKLPVSQSAIDKAAGDLYAKQGRHIEAQMYYKKAMAREIIDPDVYHAYAKSLMATRNYQDAPFFFALARRFDQFNNESLIGTAKCIAAYESIDGGIRILQDEMLKIGGARAELLTAIAELQIQKGEWDLAQQYVNQAQEADPEYALPWKVQAQIYMNRESTDKKALDKALDAYKYYSDRNLSDPIGYLERYRVFVKKAEFEKAEEELAKIYALYPKYPNYHFYKGSLYSVMGNHQRAIDEFKEELKNNTASVPTMINLGKELLEVGNAQEALGYFNKAMQLVPTSAEPKHLSAWANYLLKNYQGAIALYNAALYYDKGNPLIYKRMGMAYREMGDEQGARTAFRKYLEMEPDAPDRGEFQRYQ